MIVLAESTSRKFRAEEHLLHIGAHVVVASREEFLKACKHPTLLGSHRIENFAVFLDVLTQTLEQLHKKVTVSAHETPSDWIARFALDAAEEEVRFHPHHACLTLIRRVCVHAIDLLLLRLATSSTRIERGR